MRHHFYYLIVATLILQWVRKILHKLSHCLNRIFCNTHIKLNFLIIFLNYSGAAD
jgi:hypothetical protein